MTSPSRPTRRPDPWQRQPGSLVAQGATGVIVLVWLLQLFAASPAEAFEVSVRARTTLQVEPYADGRSLLITGVLRDNVYQGLHDRTVVVWLARPGWEPIDRDGSPAMGRDYAPSRENAAMVRRVRTDRNGRFEFADVLDDGVWVIGVDFDGGRHHAPVRTTRAVELSRDELTIDLAAPSATPYWAPLSVIVQATRNGQPEPGIPLLVRVDGTEIGEGRATNEFGELQASIDRLEAPGMTNIRTAFGGNSHFAPASAFMDVMAYEWARLPLEATLIDRRDERKVAVLGRLVTDQGVVPGAAVELTVEPGARSWLLTTDERGEFRLPVPLTEGDTGVLTATATFRPFDSDDPDLTIVGLARLEIKRGVVPTVSSWAKPAAALACCVLLLVAIGRRIRHRLKQRKARVPRTAPILKAATKGLIEYGPPLLAQKEHAWVVSGSIRDADLGVALSRAEVELVYRGENKLKIPATTEGFFSTGELEPGSYVLRISCPGFVAMTSDVSIPHKGRFVGMEVYLVSVRSWVRHHYRRFAEDLALGGEEPIKWGWFTPRQIEDAAGKVYSQIHVEGMAQANLTFRERLRAALQRKEGDSEGILLEALTLLVEEVYFSERVYAEDMVKVCKKLVNELKRAVRQPRETDAPPNSKSPKPGRAARNLLLLLSIVLAGQAVHGVAFAQPAEDYDPLSTDWNGLAHLLDMLSAGRPQVIVDEPIDLTTHPIDHPIVIIYPTLEPPAGELLEFVHEGGRLLVADDHGNAEQLLEVLGVAVFPDRTPHQTFFRNNPGLPVFYPGGRHALTSGVELILANHPTALAADGRAVLPYDDPEYGLLYDLSYGNGRAIALGDPSLLINFMLDMADNRTLVNNIFRHLCEELEPCTVHIVTTQTEISGDFPGPPLDLSQDEVETDDLAERLAEVNALLGRFADFTPNPAGVHWAAVFLSLGVSLFLMLALPITRPDWLQFSLTADKRQKSRSEFEWNLERILDEGKTGDYSLPLAILREEFERLVLPKLAKNPGELDEEVRYEPESLERFAHRFADAVAKLNKNTRKRASALKAHNTLKLIAVLPERNSLVPEVDARYSERTFRRAFVAVRAMIRDLGIWEEYEQRTGRP